MLAARGDPEERQTDSSDSEGPVNSKEIVVGEEEGEEMSDEDWSNCSEFLKDFYDLEKKPPVIYTKDNSRDIFPEFFPKKRKRKRNSKTAGGRGRSGYHAVNEENLNHIGDSDDDDDDDYILGGYTKPIQKEPLILRRSREDIREELLESDDTEFDEDQGGYTRNTLDQPTIIGDDNGTCELGCKTDETTSDPDGGYTCSFLLTDETNPVVEDEPQSDNSDSDECIDYAGSEQHKSQLLVMPNQGNLEAIDEWSRMGQQ